MDGCEVKELKEKELREFRRHVGMIFQQFSLLERQTVYQNVAASHAMLGNTVKKR